MKRTLLAVGLVVAGVAQAANPGNWKSMWGIEMDDAKARCAKLFDAYQMQAVCLENEQRGYDELQGDFGLPRDVANKAKDRCAKIFDAFQMQAVCMQNEKDGYDKVNR